MRRFPDAIRTGPSEGVVGTIYACAIVGTTMAAELSLEGCHCPYLWGGSALLGGLGLYLGWSRGKRRKGQDTYMDGE